MTPKEKAIELVNKFYNIIYLDMDYEQAKYAALIAVDEMIDIRNGLYYNDSSLAFKYLDEVKKEIQNL